LGSGDDAFKPAEITFCTIATEFPRCLAYSGSRASNALWLPLDAPRDAIIADAMALLLTQPKLNLSREESGFHGELESPLSLRSRSSARPFQPSARKLKDCRACASPAAAASFAAYAADARQRTSRSRRLSSSSVIWRASRVDCQTDCQGAGYQFRGLRRHQAVRRSRQDPTNAATIRSGSTVRFRTFSTTGHLNALGV
jgi:hypothetical protein